MTTFELKQINGYRSIDIPGFKACHTSGQPSVDQFSWIAQQGCQQVVNLAMPDSTNAIETEGSLVTQLGMNYYHLPICWETPSLGQFEHFAHLLNGFHQQSIWVHCALNMRVSCFIYAYRKLYKHASEAEARTDLEAIWTPNDNWQYFLQNCCRATAKAQ